jgi:hypothetical protein
VTLSIEAILTAKFLVETTEMHRVYVCRMCCSTSEETGNPAMGTAHAELKKDISRTTVFVLTADHSLVHTLV